MQVGCGTKGDTKELLTPAEGAAMPILCKATEAAQHVQQVNRLVARVASGDS